MSFNCEIRKHLLGITFNFPYITYEAQHRQSSTKSMSSTVVSEGNRPSSC